MTARVPHCGDDTTMAVPEPYWKQLQHLISGESYHEL